MNFKLKKMDRKYLVNTLRALNSLTPAPSNISDLYDLNLIKSRISSGNGTVKVFLDNNVLTRVINLPVEGISDDRKLTAEEKNICCLMGYFTYSGMLTIPNISMYESQSTPSPAARIQADILFRYFDHLPSQVYLNFAQGRINSVPYADWISVKQEVDSNPLTQKDISTNAYEGEVSSKKTFALNMMKAWIVKKEGMSFEESIEKLMDWIFENSISDQSNFLYFIFLMSGDRLGSMLKRINSSDPEVVIKNINNAAWDLAQINLFLSCASKYYKDSIFVFCSRDKILHDLLRISLKIKDKTKLDEYVDKNYTKKQGELLKQLNDRHNTRSEREKHIKKIEASLDGSIESMVDEIHGHFQY